MLWWTHYTPVTVQVVWSICFVDSQWWHSESPSVTPRRWSIAGSLDPFRYRLMMSLHCLGLGSQRLYKSQTISPSQLRCYDHFSPFFFFLFFSEKPDQRPVPFKCSLSVGKKVMISNVKAFRSGTWEITQVWCYDRLYNIVSDMSAMWQEVIKNETKTG